MSLKNVLKKKDLINRLVDWETAFDGTEVSTEKNKIMTRS